jgi:tetratricopeptide (TPR) repeat protein
MKMKSVLSLLALMTLSVARGQNPPSQTPAERKVAWAEQQVHAKVHANPSRYQAYNDLAKAMVARAMETLDPELYDRAQQAVDKSLSLAPGNFEAEKLEVAVHLGRHEYPAALEKARLLNRRMPDDVMTYAYVADAGMALGNYDEAEHEIQWMLDIRPGNVPAYIRGARLRALWGDPDGAIEFLNQAALQVPPEETADQADLFTESAGLQLMQGRVEAASKAAVQALAIFPGYPVALEALARARTVQGRYADAVKALKQRNEKSPSLSSRYQLAEALKRAGMNEEAQSVFADFEHAARVVLDRAGEDNFDLIFFYADHAGKPVEALKLAEQEITRRHDVYAQDALAWALYVNSDYQKARDELDGALKTGIRDSRMLYHAGAIAAALKDRRAATRAFQQSLDSGPVPEIAAADREGLQKLSASASLHVSE